MPFGIAGYGSVDGNPVGTPFFFPYFLCIHDIHNLPEHAYDDIVFTGKLTLTAENIENRCFGIFHLTLENRFTGTFGYIHRQLLIPVPGIFSRYGTQVLQYERLDGLLINVAHKGKNKTARVGKTLPEHLHDTPVIDFIHILCLQPVEKGIIVIEFSCDRILKRDRRLGFRIFQLYLGPLQERFESILVGSRRSKIEINQLKQCFEIPLRRGSVESLLHDSEQGGDRDVFTRQHLGQFRKAEISHTPQRGYLSGHFAIDRILQGIRGGTSMTRGRHQYLIVFKIRFFEDHGHTI